MCSLSGEWRYFGGFGMVHDPSIAAYQKFLENDKLGLTNATKQVKDVITNYGITGLQMDGHSRGTLTIINAYSSLLNDEENIGKYTALRTNMVGPAANVRNADAKLADLQGRNTGNYTEQVVGCIPCTIKTFLKPSQYLPTNTDIYLKNRHRSHDGDFLLSISANKAKRRGGVSLAAI